MTSGAVVREKSRQIAEEFSRLLGQAMQSGGRIDLRLQRAIDEAHSIIRRLLEQEPQAISSQQRPERHKPSRSDAADQQDDIQVLGRADIGQWPDQDEFQTQEITTPGSSNVYSYFFRLDTPPGRKGIVSPGQMGTLFVTFRAWRPGQKDRPFVRGSMYAYSNVPQSKFGQFSAMATGTAGGAVWEYLRVRGTVSGHQHPYRLNSAGSIPGGGVYIPRKATAAGFQRRAMIGGLTSTTAWQFSTLAAQPFGQAEQKRTFAQWRRLAPEINKSFRGKASSGEPNRGTPNTGAP